MIKNYSFIFLTVICLLFSCDTFSSWRRPKVEGGRPNDQSHHITQTSIQWPNIPKKVTVPLGILGGIFTLWKIDEIYYHNKTVEELSTEKNKLASDYGSALTLNEKRVLLNNYIYDFRERSGFFEDHTLRFLRHTKQMILRRPGNLRILIPYKQYFSQILPRKTWITYKQGL